MSKPKDAHASSLVVRPLEKGQAGVWPEHSALKQVGGEVIGLTPVQGGTKGGKTSVSVVVQLEDGTIVHAQTTAALFLTAAAALRGHMERWNDKWTGV